MDTKLNICFMKDQAGSNFLPSWIEKESIKQILPDLPMTIINDWLEESTLEQVRRLASPRRTLYKTYDVVKFFDSVYTRLGGAK